MCHRAPCRDNYATACRPVKVVKRENYLVPGPEDVQDHDNWLSLFISDYKRSLTLSIPHSRSRTCDRFNY
ncbi:hypothetical protein N7471_000078 [Penicillium samsonianum]|uniref:uncharacterized protein n=1 Tax=Penicillium samsonianum TaxID=1882272 RepID=UPI002546DEC4|nr:uncharacterized protein N7471_000078 [Penicillium samsonianum]KAJ6148879.1 hypothetical protein N7471_000078 [Penicillium samsonianum]